MEQQSKQQSPSLKTVLQKVWSGLKAYLTDWRNLLGHALLGVLFVVIAIWAPIHIWLKLLIIASLITLNVFRMRNKNIKNAAKERVSE